MSTSQPSSSLTTSLRRWWWLPLLGAVLGGLLGLLAGSSTTYTATALVESHVQGFEAQAVAQGAQTALSGLTTPEVFTAAGSASGVDATNLRDRSRVAIVGDSPVISIAVTAPTKAASIAQANAIATAGLAESTKRITADLTQLRNQTRQLLQSGSLATLPRSNQSSQTAASLVPYGAAELGRQDAMGRALGQAQANRLTGQGRITLLQRAGDATVARDVSKSIAAMSAVGGLLLGLAAALLLGSRGSRVRSADSLRRQRPGLSVAEDADLQALLEMDGGHERVLVVAPEGSELPRRVGSLTKREVRTATPGSLVADRLARDPRTLVLLDAPRTGLVADVDRMTATRDDTVVVVGS